MANEVTSSAVSALYANVVAEATFLAQERSIMRPLVRVQDIAGVAGKTVQFPIYPTVAAADLTEGQAIGNTLVTPDAVEITVAEIGVGTLVTDLARNSATGDLVGALGRLFGEGIAKKMDQKVIAEFANFTNSLGAAGADLTAELIFKAVATLRAQSVYSPMYGVFHPSQTFALKRALANAGSANVPALSDAGNAALAEGFIGTIAGVQLFESAAIAVDGNGDAVGGIFTRDALGVAMKRDLTIEAQRNAKARGDDLVAHMVMGAGALVPAYGVKIIANATL